MLGSKFTSKVISRSVELIGIEEAVTSDKEESFQKSFVTTKPTVTILTPNAPYKERPKSGLTSYKSSKSVSKDVTVKIP